jgi:hypothetical protein
MIGGVMTAGLTAGVGQGGLAALLGSARGTGEQAHSAAGALSALQVLLTVGRALSGPGGVLTARHLPRIARRVLSVPTEALSVLQLPLTVGRNLTHLGGAPSALLPPRIVGRAMKGLVGAL